MIKQVVSVVVLGMFGALLVPGCGGDAEANGTGGAASGGSAGSAASGGLGADGGGGTSGVAGGAADAGWTPDGPVQTSDSGVVITEDGGFSFTCYPTSCAGKLLQCGNCTDDDGDGRIDWRDPECLGPCDNTEGPGLDSDVGGTTGTSCGVDCYFDFGNGPGNDDCLWDHRCDVLDPESATCAYEASRVGSKDCPAKQSDKCAAFCKPYTPNGCDCFGCCTFPELAGQASGGADEYVWIGALDASNTSTCTLAALGDPAKCPRCTPVGNCLNTCGHCELCVGKTTVPADCLPSDGGVTPDGSTADGGTGQCAAGLQPCGLPGQAACPLNSYCTTGCCIEQVR